MNEKMVLPKLKIVGEGSPKRPKILLLSDDLRMHSGIATMSREFVIGTSDRFDWVQLGAALNHPDHGKIFDESKSVDDITGRNDANVKIYAHTGYGNPDVLRELITIEKPDAILHFTDPRFWEWLYSMEHELRGVSKIPIMYYNIWDAPPAPFWNKAYYESCDLVMNISKQTHALVKIVLGDDGYNDLDTGDGRGDVMISYVPHGVNPKFFFPITDEHPDYVEYKELRDNFMKQNDIDFLVMWNNRNIRRKMPGDLILAYKQFCDSLPPEKAKRVGLFLKTAMRDPNGTDIPEVVRVVCPDYKVIFNEERLPTRILNMFYNMADVTVNMASNEGFGLSSAESIMAGTPIINNVTGGLQDQMRFVDTDGNPMAFDNNFTSNHTGRYTEHGVWAKAVFPTNRSLQGSLATPYIFDDRCDFSDVASKLLEWYNTDTATRKDAGLAGRYWMLTEDSGMSSQHMSDRMAAAITKCIENFKPRSLYRVVKVTNNKKVDTNGIVYK